MVSGERFYEVDFKEVVFNRELFGWFLVFTVHPQYKKRN